MLPDVDMQALESADSKRPKTHDNTKPEDLVYSPESPDRRHSNIARPLWRRMALPGSALDAFSTDDDYQQLRLRYGISDDDLKNAWEMCRRLDLFDVFDSYSDDDLHTVFNIFRYKEAWQFFRKIHQAAGVGHGQGK